MGKEYTIINMLTYQLNELENLIKRDVERGNMIYNYYINEKECKLLDYDKLQTYLTVTDIKNLASLRDIHRRCGRINNLWNDDLRTLKPKKLDKPFFVKEAENKSGWGMHSSIDFHVIYLTAVKFHYITFEDEKKKVMINWRDNNTLVRTHLANINTRCNDIRNLLVDFYPLLRQEKDPEEGLIQYRNFGKFEFSPRPYKDHEYDLMKDVFNKHLSDCKYIFLSLDKKEQQGFKNHIIKNLNDVKNIQVLPKFKDLLSEIIELSNNDFSKPQQPTKNSNTSTKPPSEEKNEFGFKNNFDSVTEKKVYDYFYKKLVETKYLTDEVLVEYLILAFQKCKKSKCKFTLNNKTSNKKIQAIFYNYYKDIAGKPYGKQKAYIELLGDYFVGFDTGTLITNFSKTY